MYKIKEYHPDFCSGFKNAEATFDTPEEFLKIGFVKEFTKQSGYKGFLVYQEDFVHGMILCQVRACQGIIEQWGVANIVCGDINELKNVFHSIWNLKEVVPFY